MEQAPLVAGSCITGRSGDDGFGGAVDLAGAAGVAVRHIQRYTFAAMQDQSPIVGLTHASYALNGLDMLEEAGGGEAVRMMGFSPSKVRALISAIQDRHAKALHAADPYITQVLGMREGLEFADAGLAPLRMGRDGLLFPRAIRGHHDRNRPGASTWDRIFNIVGSGLGTTCLTLSLSRGQRRMA